LINSYVKKRFPENRTLWEMACLHDFFQVRRGEIMKLKLIRFNLTGRASAALWSAVAVAISYKNVAYVKVLTQKCILYDGLRSSFLGKVLEL
jgi:hypothetical protein